ncbi:MAG: PspA/IM30 family protein [candidate division KSB1 bacterium]|nr:PspA/IM30 family protein [candidate division KSB1 bacterium]MDZ7275659.1 PspA/IM30 family protein [candidate division KSB1 bacterium]MDZ7284650.1 PspA/IM30 family protein [candidate division KSB1 bacterium]MDZ7297931.1 PspA/IM30 family protein [candidate division KSB1 bacterium]MDZ7307104.1 PspA/IM30 family protein [candidate division KSB1 bacterium]
MPSIFQRVFKIAQSEAHAAIDKLEDPIKLTEQGIRDLKNDLQAAMVSLAQVKALAIRMKKDAEEQQRLAADYERKAMLLLQRGQSGELEAAQADKLATEALTRKEEAAQRANSLLTDYQAQEKMAGQLQVKVDKLKQTITRYENELATLKARARTASSMRKINQQLANVDSSSTLHMLERMKNKVSEEEALAEAYGEVVTGGTSLDEQIDQALATPAAAKAADSLAELKKKMGLTAG